MTGRFRWRRSSGEQKATQDDIDALKEFDGGAGLPAITDAEGYPHKQKAFLQVTSAAEQQLLR